jgi:glycosyltransferase involved in cell wall biosynthesis
LCAGQIAPFKGTHLAVEATLALLSKGEDVQLIVAGGLPAWPPEYVEYYSRMRHRIDESGHESRFHFVGHVENVPALMKESYLLLAPYQGEESFGIVVLEALSVGLPVVAFRLGAIPELVEHGGTGYLCADPKTESLVAGIEYYLSDPDAWKDARERCLQRFNERDFGCSPGTFSRSWRGLFSIDDSASADFDV